MSSSNTRTQCGMADVGLLIMRLMLASVFIFHGSQKVFGAFGGSGIGEFTAFLSALEVPMPVVSAWLAALAELVGGLALLTGVAMRLLSVPLAATMLVAAFKVHSGFDIQSGGMEYPLTLAVMVIGLALIGPGRLTVTHALGFGGKKTSSHKTR